jgi:molybdate transport system permease protein
MNDQLLFSLRLSLQVAAVATVFVVLIGIAAAYLLGRRTFRGKEAVDMVFTLPLVLPPTVTGYLLIVLLGRNGLLGRYLYEWTGWSVMFTWYAAVVASIVVALPLMIKTTRAAIESVDEKYIRASHTLGHSEWWTVWKVILPLAKKGILAGAILSFARAMGEFGATLMVAGNIPGRTDTMPLAIYSASAGGDRMQANVMVLLFTVVSGLFLFAANRLNSRQSLSPRQSR